jgi:hypothetical protein
MTMGISHNKMKTGTLFIRANSYYFIKTKNNEEKTYQ